MMTTNDPYQRGLHAFQTWQSLSVNLETGDVGVGTPQTPEAPPENPFPQGSKHYEEWEQGFSDAVDYAIRGEYIDDEE